MIKKTLFISLIAVLLSFQSAIGEDVIRPRSLVIPPSSFSQKSTYYDVGDDESGFSLGIEGGANLNLFAQDMF